MHGRRHILSMFGLGAAVAVTPRAAHAAARIRTFQYHVRPIGDTIRVPIEAQGDVHVYVDGRRLSAGTRDNCIQGCNYYIDRRAGEVVIILDGDVTDRFNRVRVVMDYV